MVLLFPRALGIIPPDSYTNDRIAGLGKRNRVSFMLYVVEPFSFITQCWHVTLALRCNEPLSALRALIPLFHRKPGLLGSQGPYLSGSTLSELGLMEFCFKQYGPFLHREEL